MVRDGVSLKEFIEKNHTLLSALAIFATVTALLSNLPIKWIGTVLSFISMAGLIMVWYELKAQLPERMSPKLFLFSYVLLWGFGVLVFYWLLEFREIWHLLLFAPLTILFMFEIIQTLNPLREWSVAKRVFGIGKEKNWFQKMFKVAVALGIGFISFYFAALFSSPLNMVFDVIKNTFR